MTKTKINTKITSAIILVSIVIGIVALFAMMIPRTAKAFDPKDAYNPTTISPIDPNSSGPFIGQNLGNNDTPPTSQTCQSGDLYNEDHAITYGREYYMSFWAKNIGEVELKVQGRISYYYIMTNRTFYSDTAWKKFTIKFYGATNENGNFVIKSNSNICFGNLQIINTGMINVTPPVAPVDLKYFGHHNTGYFDGNYGWASDQGFKMGYLRSFYCGDKNNDGNYQGLSQWERTNSRGQELQCVFPYPSTISNPNETTILTDQEIRLKSRELATAYKGKVKYWEGPNEYDQFYPPDQNPRRNAREAVRYARIMSEEFKAIDPDVKILSGNTIYYTGLEAWDEFLKNGGGEHVDIFAHHGFGIHSHNLKELFASYGYQNKEVWMTEGGTEPDSICQSYPLEMLVTSFVAKDKRFGWYSTDAHDVRILNGNNQPTIAGIGLKTSSKWLLDSKIESFKITPNGQHIAKIIRPSNQIAYLVWQKSSTDTTTLVIDPSWNINKAFDLTENEVPIAGTNFTLLKNQGYLLETNDFVAVSASSSVSSSLSTSVSSSVSSSMSSSVDSSVSLQSSSVSSSIISSSVLSSIPSSSRVASSSVASSSIVSSSITNSSSILSSSSSNSYSSISSLVSSSPITSSSILSSSIISSSSSALASSSSFSPNSSSTDSSSQSSNINSSSSLSISLVSSSSANSNSNSSQVSSSSQSSISPKAISSNPVVVNNNLSINTNVFQSPLSVIRDIFNFKNDPIRLESLDIEDPYSCELQNIHGSYSGNSSLLKNINLRITNTAGLNSIIDLKPYLTGKNYTFPVNSENPNSPNYFAEGDYKVFYSVTDIYDQIKEYSYDAKFQKKENCTPKQSANYLTQNNQNQSQSQTQSQSVLPNSESTSINSVSKDQIETSKLARTGGYGGIQSLFAIVILIITTFKIQKSLKPNSVKK